MRIPLVDVREPWLRFMLSISRRFARGQILSTIPFIATDIARIPMTFCVKNLVSELLAGASIWSLVPLVAAIIGLGSFIVAMQGLAEYLSSVLDYRARVWLCEEIVGKVLRLRGEVWRRLSPSEVLSRLVSDVEAVTIAATMLGDIAAAMFKIAVVIYIFVALSPPLAAIVLAMTPPYFLLLKYFRSRLYRAQVEERREYDRVIGVLKSVLDGREALRSLSAYSYGVWLARSSMLRWLDRARRALRYLILSARVNDIFRVFFPMTILAVGVLMVSLGLATLPAVIAFYMNLGALYYPINFAMNLWVEIQRSRPSAERILSILSLPEEERGEEPFPPRIEAISVRGLRYSYDSREVLRGIDIDIRGGEHIAIVGESGAGKTTLAKILARLLEDYEGSITVNGVEVRRIRVDEYRRNVVYLDSRAYLLNASVRDNIILGREVPEEELRRVMEVCAIDFVDSLDQVVGEEGTALSEGQRQRIALARALIQRPRVLILDEALSGVDSRTEGWILSKLREEGITLIIVSHRLSTIMAADRVMVLHEGRIACVGRHSELLRECEVYRRLVERQIIRAE